MSYSRYLAYLVVLLSGLCFGAKASAEVAAPADTTYLLFDYQRSPRMMRIREFAPRFKAYLARPREEHGPQNLPKNKGWLSLRPVWQGLQDSLQLPLFAYDTGWYAPKAMLLLYVDRIDTLFTPPQRYTTISAFVEVMYKVPGHVAYFDETLYVVTRDYRGRMLRHRVNYVDLRHYVYRGHDICVIYHTAEAIPYRRANFFAHDLFPNQITRQEIARDKELYRQLLRYGFLSEQLPLGPYFTF
nr:hypothetical protein [uncultured Porphyromonas sp.]